MFGPQMALKMGCYFAFIAIDFREIFNATLIDNYVGRKALFLFLVVFSLILYVCRLLLINYICERVSFKVSVLLHPHAKCIYHESNPNKIV